MKLLARSLSIAALMCAACAQKPPARSVDVIESLGATQLVTLTNLHPDDDNLQLYTANFQQPGLIPICSKVTLTSGGDGWLRFTVDATAKEYQYDTHLASAEPFIDNVKRYFGGACPTAKIESLTEMEREALRMGIAVPGMRKDAVILSLGYPPLRDTPSLDAAMWKYWSSRLRFFLVYFDKSGKVERIQY